MQIQCRNCGHAEVTNLELFVKIIGRAAPLSGFWAWTTYLFAGTGFALPIVVAIITGGVGMLVFKDQIVLWLTNKGYQCSNCSISNWQPLVATPEPALPFVYEQLGQDARPLAKVSDKDGESKMILAALVEIQRIVNETCPRLNLVLQRDSVFGQLLQAADSNQFETAATLVKLVVASLCISPTNAERGLLMYRFIARREDPGFGV